MEEIAVILQELILQHRELQLMALTVGGKVRRQLCAVDLAGETPVVASLCIGLDGAGDEIMLAM